MRTAIVNISKLDEGMLNPSRYVGADTQGPRYKCRYVTTITEAHRHTTLTGAGHFTRDNCGIREALGQILKQDIGKQVWAHMDNADNREVYQVESTEQRDKRLAAGHDGGRAESLEAQAQELAHRHALEMSELMER